MTTELAVWRGGSLAAPLTLLAALCVPVAAAYGVTLEALELILFTCALFAASAVDARRRIVPNGALLAAVAARALFLAAAGVAQACGADAALVFGDGASCDLAALVVGSAASAVAVGACFLAMAAIADRLCGRESLGGGDVKLLAVVGLYFGWRQSLAIAFLACALGLAFSLARIAHARLAGAKFDGTFPFAPFISASCWATMLLGA